MKSLLSILLCSLPVFSADAVRVPFDVTLGAMVTHGRTVSGDRAQTETVTLEMNEISPGAAIGVKHVWSGNVTKTKRILGNDVSTQIFIRKSEGTDGKIYWWAQIRFNNRNTASVGGTDLKGLRLIGDGAPQSLPNGDTLEPNTMVDFK